MTIDLTKAQMRRRSYLAATVASLGISGCYGNKKDGSENNNTDRNRKLEDASPGQIDDFEDLSRWTVSSGSLSADTEYTTVGTQSARIEVPESQQEAWIEMELSSPVDLSDVVPTLSCRATEALYPRIHLFDVNDSRIDFRTSVAGELPFHQNSFGVENVVDNPDTAQTTRIAISLWAGDDAATIWVDDLTLVPRPDTGKVLIQFDDGYETDYTEAFQVLNQYGYPATTFINPDYVGTSASLSLEQIHELYRSGWSVGSHAYEHSRLSDQDDAEKEELIRDAKEWLIERGLERGADYFAYPFADFDQRTLEFVEEYHELGFASGWPVNGYMSNRLLCPRIGEPNFEQARTILDRTADFRGITTLFYHELDDESRSEFELTISHLNDLESNNELDVILPQDLEQEFVYNPDGTVS